MYELAHIGLLHHHQHREKIEKIEKIEKDTYLLRESMYILGSLIKEQDDSLNTIENEIKNSSNNVRDSVDELDTSSEYNYSYLNTIAVVFGTVGALVYLLF